MKIGYARISTEEQNLDLQLDALNDAGCDTLFTDEGMSGASIERNGLSQAISAVGEGDNRITKLIRFRFCPIIITKCQPSK